MKLNEKRLIELGFKLIRERDPQDDKDGIWYHDKLHISIYQDFWKGDSFMFPEMYDEEGEPKGGFIIPTDERLAILVEGLTGVKHIQL